MAITIESVAPTSRVHRRPKHKFYIKTRPYQIVPFMIAPVLPAETLSSWWMEAREVTKPIRSSLIGWATEYYLFYVKIRDLNERDTLDDLFINPSADVSGLNEAYNGAYYHPGNAPNYAKLCLKRVTETWFRDEGEAWNNADIGDYPSAQMRDQGWMDSMVDTTTLSAGVGDPGAATTPEALEQLMDAYEQLRAMSFTSMSFEDYCRTFGINISQETVHKPELLASAKEWQYPSNTIDPADGSPTAAVSWVLKKSGREAKLFKEPGFIFGVHIMRPKVYMNRQFGSMAHFLNRGLSWLPAIMRNQPETSLREFPGGSDTAASPLSNDTANATPTNGFWVDMRDLFLYGDQFHNYGLTGGGAQHMLSIPTAALVRKYLTSDDVDALFIGEDKFAEADGFCSLDIKGSQIDYTGGHQAER